MSFSLSWFTNLDKFERLVNSYHSFFTIEEITLCTFAQNELYSTETLVSQVLFRWFLVRCLCFVVWC